MNLSFLVSNNWEELKRKFPDAYNFLLGESLHNEYQWYKNRKSPLNEWEQKRSEELTKLFES